MSLRATSTILLLALSATAAPTASAQSAASIRATEPATERVVDLTLTDAAMAVSDPVRPIIYYNPVVLARTGPAMAEFILAHEEAHIALRHVRVVNGVSNTARLRRLELDADCAATRLLAARRPESVKAAVMFFRSLGSKRIDEVHPSGDERANRIVECASLKEAEG